MYCPYCGEQNAIMFGGVGHLFTKENSPSVVRGDALHALSSVHKGDPYLTPFLCDDCKKWFAIFSLSSKGNDEDGEK